MKLERHHAIRASRRSRRPLGAAAAFVLASVACTGDNVAPDDRAPGGASGADPIGTPGTTGTAGATGAPGTLGTPGTDGTTSPVQAYGLSADPSLDLVAVATGSAAGPVTLLNGNDGVPLHVLKPTTQKTNSAIVRQASGLIAVADIDVVWVFRADGALLRGIPQTAGINGMALSADGAEFLRATFELRTAGEKPPPPPRRRRR